MEDEDKKVIRVGSRKSELALIQTNFVIDSLKKVNPDKEFTIVTMTTLGDRILNVSLPKIGEKSLFTKDLEDALRNNTVDFVVHSLKDLPTTLPDGLAVGAVFEREDPRDALVLREDLKGHTLASLPENSVIGTSSLRRTAQLHSSHPHLIVRDVRGNLNTRLRKLDAGTNQDAGTGTRKDEGTAKDAGTMADKGADAEKPYAALVLASAGLERMGWQDRISRRIPCGEMLYAVGQGALGVECRADDAAILSLLAPHSHAQSYARALAERSFLKTLGGGCSAPVGVSTSLKQLETEYKLTLSGAVWSLDGKTKIHHKMERTFPQIKKTAKHRLSPTEQSDSKKLKAADENPVERLNREIDENVLSMGCEDTRTTEEIEALRQKSKIFCGMTANFSMPIEVIVRCEDLGKDLAESLISKGALEVMQVTKDLIHSSIDAKQS